MPDGGTLRVAVISEAQADQRNACLLADRVALASIAWLEPDLLDAVREWCGAIPATPFLKWTAVRGEADQRGIKAHGHFSSEPAEPDAHAARRALLVARSYEPGVSAVLLIRDSDDDERRLAGLRQARDKSKECPWPFVVVIGVPHTKRECWLLAAHCPQGDDESKEHVAVCKELGFDPCLCSDRLKKNAKRVKDTHCPDDGERGLNETALNVLKERGRENGLADYLGELETRYMPLFRRPK